MEPLTSEQMADLSDSLATQAAAYARSAAVHVVDLAAAMGFAAAMVLRANLNPTDALEQWQRVAAAVTEALTDEEPDHGRPH